MRLSKTSCQRNVSLIIAKNSWLVQQLENFYHLSFSHRFLFSYPGTLWFVVVNEPDLDLSHARREMSQLLSLSLIGVDESIPIFKHK